ncbi:MAG: hypothetical protein IPL88_13665 [Rhizobiales bacterium]|nr:hypothetical protein [Hyphomicrobiales bacterium]
MRAFLAAVAAVLALGTVAWATLNPRAETVSEAYVTSGVRLGADGGSNLIGKSH